jgi:hypothetical protein
MSVKLITIQFHNPKTIAVTVVTMNIITLSCNFRLLAAYFHCMNFTTKKQNSYLNFLNSTTNNFVWRSIKELLALAKKEICATE